MAKPSYKPREFHKLVKKHYSEVKDVHHKGLPHAIEKMFEYHDVIKASDVKEALKGEQIQGNSVYNAFSELVEAGKIYRDGSGIYVKAGVGKPPSKALEKSRARFDGMASFLSPSREELDAFVMFVHDGMKSGIKTGQMVEHIMENIPHRVAEKYADLPEETKTVKGEKVDVKEKRIRRNLSKRIGTRLINIRNKLTGEDGNPLVVSAGPPKNRVHSYYGVEIDESLFAVPEPVAEPKPLGRHPQMDHFQKALTAARKTIKKAKKRGVDVGPFLSELNEIAESREEINASLHESDTNKLTAAVSKIEALREKVRSTGGTKRRSPKPSAQKPPKPEEKYFVPGHGRLTASEVVKILNKGRFTNARSLAWKLNKHLGLSSLEGLFSDPRVKKALKKYS